MEILSITTSLGRYGGAQKVLLDVHDGIKVKYRAKIIGFRKFEDLHPKCNIGQDEYVKFRNPFYLNNKILIVHARNVMALIMILKWVFFLNTKLLYVSHNVYRNHKHISFFPSNIISISNKVTDNLLNYFKLKKEHIRLIYNGIQDNAGNLSPILPAEQIIILYSARINNVKRQLEIVDRLSGKLSPKIKIHFAGTGPDAGLLKEKCKNSINFKVLGFVEDVGEVIAKCHYVMLYSYQEGLPLSLIEGAMYGKPLLVNDVGGNLEIGVPGKNGILLKDDWIVLAETLNGLLSISEKEYVIMSEMSRKRYEHIFTYKRMIAQYLEVLNEMEQNFA